MWTQRSRWMCLKRAEIHLQVGTMVQGSDGVNDLYQLQVGQSEGNGDLMLMSRHILIDVQDPDIRTPVVVRRR
jgi:hypothetical protein